MKILYTFFCATCLFWLMYAESQGVVWWYDPHFGPGRLYNHNRAYHK